MSGQKFFAGIPRTWLWSYLVLSLIWIALHVIVIHRFRALESDSVMYGFPLAFASNPFDLKIPWIIPFQTYADDWGHSWVGGMWLRAAIFLIIPFSRVADLVLIFAALWATASIIGGLVWHLTRNWILTVCSLIMILSDRVMINQLQLHRFESIAAFFLTSKASARKFLRKFHKNEKFLFRLHSGTPHYSTRTTLFNYPA